MNSVKKILKKYPPVSNAYQFIVQQLKLSRDLLNSVKRYKASHSYSQCGEDLIIDFLFENYLKISKPTYLDIGAHHPTYLSNTYRLYERGCHGVCVEPDPTLCIEIKNKRKRDVCLNVGIGLSEEAVANFYIMTTRTLNTFSKEEAERYQIYDNQQIEQVIQIPLVPVNNVIQQNFDTCPDFISLDVEGLDLQILRSFDFSTFRPQVFCLETLTYSQDYTEQKIEEIIELMISKGYFIYADTYINTIFVDKQTWAQRK